MAFSHSDRPQSSSPKVPNRFSETQGVRHKLAIQPSLPGSLIPMALHVDVLAVLSGNGLFEAWVPGPHFGALPITSRVAVVPSLHRCNAPVQVHRSKGAARDAH